MVINRFDIYIVSLDPIEFQGKKGQIVLDQIRTVDKKRLIKKIGRVKQATYEKALSILQEMFEI